MKKVSGLWFVLLVIALAFVFSSAASAVPDPPPNDNVCICHQTQHHKNNIGQANPNQKGVLICVDPNSLPANKHFKHGDDCVEPFNQAPACNGNSTTLAECTGETPCSLDDNPFRPECCAELIDPQGSEDQCDLAADVVGCAACIQN
ncbi:MAG TPA: hypothetical protein VHR17_05005 [Thermoanaerobaculia bacterium]|jgi:hypothetical protein|nr:hypothetical protein [Thermoanaerobaculia bacterium]